MKRTLLLLFFAIGLGYLGWGQTSFTATYTFTGTTGHVASFAYNGTVYDGITPENILKVGVTSASSTGNFRATGWPTGALSGSDVFTGSVDLAKYIGFTITAVDGYKFTVTSITFGVGRSATGIRQSQWRGSDDSYASIIDNYTTLNASLTNTAGVLTNPDANSSYTGNELSLGSTYVDITGTCGFRYYLFNSESSSGTSGLQGPITITGTFDVNSGTPTAATPAFSPAGGTVTATQLVTISTTTPAATIYYTTDGSNPDNTKPEYTSPVEITTTTTLKAIAYATDYNPSSIATAIYTFPIEVSNISTLRAGTTGGTVYKLTGEAFLTFKTANRNAKYIQDATGAILIDDNSGIITTTYNLYDGITGIIGTLTLYNNMLQFIPVLDPGVATSTGNTVTPVEVTLANLTTEYQGKLVTVKNATITETGNFVASTNYVLTDASGSAVLRSAYSDLNYIGTAIPVVQQDLTGVVLQYTTTMQLVPRSLSDFYNSPGYQLIGASDNASNYGGSWSGNGGYGFGDWNLYIDGGTSADAGHYLGNSTADGHGNINSSDSRSFGMYGNNTRYANAERSMPYWGDGATFSIQLAVQWRDGNRGISLFNSNGFAGGDQIWNFNINDAGYGSTLWDYRSDMVLTFDITQTGADLSIDVTGSSVLGSWNATVNYIVSSVTLGGFRLYTGGGTGGTQGERNLYVNNLQINTNVATIPATGNVYVKGQVDISSAVTMSSSLLIESGHILRINPTGQLTVSGGLINTNGNGGLVIESNATRTGSLIHNSNNVNATIERYLFGSTTLNATDYHLVSIPLNADVTSAQFTGMYLWQFNPTASGDARWEGLGSSETTVLDNNRGYMVFLPQTSTSVNFTGQLNNGSFTAYTLANAAAQFCLVPNPYPSVIDWDAASGWTKTLINDAIWIWNPVAGNYAAYGTQAGINNGTRYIPQGQSFFIESSNTSPVLTMNNSVRVHNTQAFYKSAEASPAELLRIKVDCEAGTSDEIVVRFNQEAGAENGLFDVAKMTGSESAPQLYTLTESSDRLSINALPHSTQTIIVPVGLEYSQDGQLGFTASGFESFESSVTIFLEDKLLNKMIDLRETPAYTFTHSTGNDALRFNLHFYGVNSTPALAAKDFNIWPTVDHLNIHIPALIGQKATVELYDLLGHLVLSQQVNLGTPTQIAVPQFNGMGIVRVIANSQVFSEKVFIQ